jgi:hypothetical protein
MLEKMSPRSATTSDVYSCNADTSDAAFAGMSSTRPVHHQGAA